MSADLKSVLAASGLLEKDAQSFMNMLEHMFAINGATEHEQIRVVKTLIAAMKEKEPMSPDLENSDSVMQLRALAADTVACTYAYGPDLRKAADEIEQLRYRVKEYERGI